MKLTNIWAIGFSVLVSYQALAETSNAPRQGWWDEPYPSTFDQTQLTKKQAFIKVKGNKLVNEQGKTVVLQGLNISDPDKLVTQGKWSAAHFDVIQQWGANAVRVPVHPVAWRKHGAEAYMQLIDQAVIWANARDLYLILDWHSIGNLSDGLYQHPMYITDKSETMQFWRSIAYRYKDVPTIAVYEIFNEPTTYNGQLGEVSWAEWKAINEEIIGLIYSHDRNVIPAVAGFNWAYDLRPVKDDPIDAQGIAYIAHPYPMKSKPPYIQSWEDTWGFVAKKYPLLATEIGFVGEGEPGAHIPVINDGSYGPIITDYLEKIGASWTTWVFDPDWGPMMISDWDYTPTKQGAYFKSVMEKNKHR
ncbi:cellulase family glycosylhydrolase [Alteromonadaceae bacterium BrNp21-10]|nr:cellulase family glycosylhydrolase [Alteromonadaceae bacterium BrNp21-10]